MVGATAVQIGTATFADPRACEKWSLDDWLSALERQGRPNEFIDYSFPTDAHHDEFIGRIQEFPEAVIRLVLNRFLIPSGILGSTNCICGLFTRC